ncbi:MAG: gamma subclass chorismate mutase AroQ [Porticoccaceae bacterium]|nr:gamma subclass chorismate mutase AroQ [Porticoccaceae bacterium]
MASLYLLAFLCLALVPAQAASSTDESGEFTRLLGLLEQRLQLMQDVAAYKYANHIAVENKQREKVVLASAMADARQQQLAPASVEAFFRLQIELAKTVQKSWLERWRAEGRVAQTTDGMADLNHDIRPQLIALGAQLVAQIPLVLSELQVINRFDEHLRAINAAITSPFINSTMKGELLQSLLQVRRLAPRDNSVLANILNSGVLRVGTTGDYAPFSLLDRTSGEYSGIDIDLAGQLAASLGVKLQLVATSWPSLMADLTANKYDIAMSGISRTLARQRRAFFSTAYSRGGKTPIARCDRAGRFNSLKKIDRDAVRVIVNPGGTNEKFVRQNIKHAEIIVYPDNTSIFAELIARHADVMITDAIEVELQHHLHPELCATMPDELFSHVEKAYLMAQDIALKEYVDAWLRELERSGALKAAFSSYLELSPSID